MDGEGALGLSFAEPALALYLKAESMLISFLPSGSVVSGGNNKWTNKGKVILEIDIPNRIIHHQHVLVDFNIHHLLMIS